jgi:hypothetical protein
MTLMSLINSPTAHCWALAAFQCTPSVGRLCGLVVRVPHCSPRGLGFDSRLYQIIREVVGLERGPLSFMRITEELLERKSSGSGLEN